jgi:putative zinc finger/helix-turn-helix YgiT family protein
MLNEQKWCPVCNKEVQTEVIEKPVTYTFKGETFQVNEKVRICSVCGSELIDEDIDTAMMSELTKKYMERKGLSFEDIQSIRRQYGLSMDLFSRILGWSKATIVRYESGKSIPDPSHMAVLKQLKDRPEDIEIFFKQNQQKFNDQQRRKIEKQLAKVGTKVVEQGLLDLLERNFKSHKGKIDSGYSEFSLEKLIHMVIFLSKRGVQKTKLMKLLWYSDFINFRRNLNSISGLPYVKLQHGPVPKDHELVLTILEKNLFIESEEIPAGDYLSTVIKATKDFDSSIFSKDELEVL